MKRLLAVPAALAVLSTVFVLASSASPASAQPPVEPIIVLVDANAPTGATFNVTSNSPNCGDGPSLTLTAVSQGNQMLLDGNCNDWTVTAVDAAGKCTVGGMYTSGSVVPASQPLPAPGNALSGIRAGFRYQLAFGLHKGLGLDPSTGWGCVSDNNLRIDKDVDSIEDASWAAAQGSFTFLVNSYSSEGTVDETSPCAASNSSYTVDGEPTESSEEILISDIVNAYIAANRVVPCTYAVTELVPTGWTVADISFWTRGEPYPCGPPPDLPDEDFSILPTAIVLLQYARSEGPAECEVDFTNKLDPIPLVVTKTFTGREYFTTIDRADFHLFTPGLCGTFPLDPFGGLLGSVGVFRTINSSQLPQVVMALPTIIPAGPDGPCTYRIQENNAPEGCVALDPTGSNADGPYWEQTWEFGVTTAMNFNIVNDCSKPEPTPEPTVAPTTDPKKPAHKPGAKKPSSGGSAAPKFTG